MNDRWRRLMQRMRRVEFSMRSFSTQDYEVEKSGKTLRPFDGKQANGCLIRERQRSAIFRLQQTETDAINKLQKASSLLALIPHDTSLQYNMTITPNSLGQSQDEAGLEAYQFHPLVEIKCSPDMRLFICSVFAPMCPIAQDYPIPPCRSLCVSAREGCEPLMMKYGFQWQEYFDCDKFPEAGSSELCVRENSAEHRTNEATRPPNI
ncbi:hypothetical protein MTO96_011955 [Rhipicephalus appendiculatus]